ncbi:phosphoenolpyruvate carboxylase [Ranunculus cassubicifolius]
MPLVRFEVRNEYGLGGTEELLLLNEASEDPKAILDGVAVAGLVGILRQLGDLAEFAADVFHNLQEQVVTTASRSHKLLVRAQHIEAALQPIEKAVQAQQTHIHFAYTPGCEWHPKIRVKQKHLIHSDLPSFITDSYEECHDPPRLHLLDKFDTVGSGACLRRYSDPSFFRKAITRSDPTSAEKVQRNKRNKKSKRWSSKWRNGDLSHVISASQRSSRLQSGSPNSYAQSSASETISAINMRLRSEQGPFDSRTRPGYTDFVYEGSSSVRREDKEHYSLPADPIKMEDGGAIDPLNHDEQNKDEIKPPGSLQDINSSSVTWDEKTEIVESNNHVPENIVEDDIVSSEFVQESSDLVQQFGEAAIQKNISPERIVLVTTDVQESISEIDEDESEPDKYADALTILESETEAESECQTIQEVVKPVVTLKSQETATDKSHIDIQKQMSILFASEEVLRSQPLEATNVSSEPDVSAEVHLSKNTSVRNSSRKDGCESPLSNPSSPLSVVPSSQHPSNDHNITSTSNVSQSTLEEVSDASTVSVWTNGGLLGLAPSKPPDFSMLNGEDPRSLSLAENNANEICPSGVDSLVETPEQREKKVERDRLAAVVNANDCHSDQLSTIGITKMNGAHHLQQTGKGNTKNQLSNVSPVKPRPPSPPLEHMKISFHPKDGYETSKLRLKFPGGHSFRETIKDVIFPTFQLLPEPSMFLQDIDSDSDDDTFCRSSPYLSDGRMSQYSESTSEMWDSDDSPDSKDHEMYDALRKVSSVESISSAFELAEISNGNIHFDSGQKKVKSENDAKKYYCDPVFDLPCFDSVISSTTEPVPVPVPPPPPLPPVEWRVTTTPTPLSEDVTTPAPLSEDVGVVESTKCSADLPVLEANLQPLKPDSPKNPKVKEPESLTKSKKNQLNFDRIREAIQADSNEREDLLNQIRSKSFSLRRTIPTRPPLPEGPPTSDKVAEIIEKANLIRKAYVGSDGGSDNWSDD